MAKLRLGSREIEDFDLPPVCAVCGREAVARPEKKFSWHPSWVLVFILIGGVLLYVILAVVLTKRLTVPLPLCQRHRNYWRNRTIFVYGGFFGIVLLAVLGIIAGVTLENGGLDGIVVFVILGVGLTFLVWLIAAAILQTTSIRPNEITERSITLVGLSVEFVDAVRDDRDAAAEEEEEWRRKKYARDDDDLPRRDKRTTEDDVGYYERKREGRERAEEDDGGYYERKRAGRRRNRDDEEDDRN